MLQKRFSNQFLDNLIADANPHEQVKMLRIFGTGLKRKELATFLNIDIHSIRRYESTWNTAKIPEWYFHILRFLSGDLSIYGELWTDSKIKLHNQCITTAFTPHEEFTPMELNSKYSFIHKQNERTINDKNRTIEGLEREIKRLKKALEHYQIVKEQNNVVEFKRN